jgi:YVTN family beta-propeller protein
MRKRLLQDYLQKNRVTILKWSDFLAAAIIGFGATSPAMTAPFAYVGLPETGLSVFDTATNKPLVVLGMPDPNGVAVTPDGKRAYVTTTPSVPSIPSVVVVVDTVSNTEVTRVQIPGLGSPGGIAITPNGKYAYIATANSPTGAVTVVNTSTNSVVATIPVNSTTPVQSIAINPDGKHAYVPTDNNVSVIDIGSNKVVGTIPVGGGLGAIAVMPDGKHAYVVSANGIAVIDLTKNKVVGSFPVGGIISGIALAPDGQHGYATNGAFPIVSVIDTQANKVVAKIPVPFSTHAVAFTPDEKRVYVGGANANVLVIDTATNTVVARVESGSIFGVSAIGIVPPPPGVPFLSFSARAAIHLVSASNQDAFQFHSQFTLSSTRSNGINPPTEALTIQAGTFTATIPPGSFTKQKDGSFTFAGAINGVTMQATIKQIGTLRYSFSATAQGANLAGSVNQVSLIVGGNSGTTSVNATKF